MYSVYDLFEVNVPRVTDVLVCKNKSIIVRKNTIEYVMVRYLIVLSSFCKLIIQA